MNDRQNLQRKQGYRKLRGILAGMLLAAGVGLGAGQGWAENIVLPNGSVIRDDHRVDPDLRTLAGAINNLGGGFVVTGLSTNSADQAANTALVQAALDAARLAGANGMQDVYVNTPGTITLGAGTSAVALDNVSTLVMGSNTHLHISPGTTLKRASGSDTIFLTNYYLNGGGTATGTTSTWDHDMVIDGGGTIDFNMAGMAFNLNSQQRNINFSRCENVAIRDLYFLNPMKSSNGDGAAVLLCNNMHGLTMERTGTNGLAILQAENDILHLHMDKNWRDASTMPHGEDYIAVGIQVKGGFGTTDYDYSDVAGPLSNRLDYQPGSVMDVAITNTEIRDTLGGSAVVFHRGAPFSGSTMTAAKACYATNLYVGNLIANNTRSGGGAVATYDDYCGADVWIGVLTIDGVTSTCPLSFSASATTITARNIQAISDGVHDAARVINVLESDSRSGTVTISSLDMEFKQLTPFTSDAAYPIHLRPKTYVKNLRLSHPELSITANVPLLLVDRAKLDYCSIVDGHFTADANNKGTIVSVGTGSTGSLVFTINGGHIDTWNKFIEAYETATLVLNGDIVANRLNYFGYSAASKTLTMTGPGSLIRSGTESGNFFIEGKLRLDCPRLRVGDHAGYLDPAGTGAPQTGDQFFATTTGWSGGGSVTSAGTILYDGTRWKNGAR